MDPDWSSHLAVNPRDLELTQTGPPAPEMSTSFYAPQAERFNATHTDFEPWPNSPAPPRSLPPKAFAEPYVEMGGFQAGMLALDEDFQFNGALGAQVANDPSISFQSMAGYEESTHRVPNAGLGAQHPLPSYMQRSIEPHQGRRSQPFNQGFQDSIAQLPAEARFVQRPRAASSSPTSNLFTPKSRRMRRSRGRLMSSAENAPPISGTSQQLKRRIRLSPQKCKSIIVAQGKKPKTGVAISQSKIFFSDSTTYIDVSKTHSVKFQEAIALVQESTKLFSPPFRRKATDLINQVAQLVNELDQLAIDEQKYGDGALDVDDDVTQPSTASLSQDSVCNSELVDSESETDNTSVSSTPRQPVAENQDPISVEDYQRMPVHPPCAQCEIKSLYFCTRGGCRYSTHSLPEWKRHEKSQKHSQQERFMCLECPASPPPLDMSGSPICEFCHNSFPAVGVNSAAHYLQCERARKANTTYGRKDRLIKHLRSHPGILNVSQTADTGRYTVNSEWPRQCGFCGEFFNAFDERMDHIAGHFQDGLDMSSWRYPSPRPKDYRPGFDPQPKGDDDDSDDDMDDNNHHPGHRTTGRRQEPIAPTSSQKKGSNENQSRGSSYPGGRKNAHQVSQPSPDNEAEPVGNNVPGRAKTSVALERYLNDAEEPIGIQLSLGTPKASDRPVDSRTTPQWTSMATHGRGGFPSSFQGMRKRFVMGKSLPNRNRVVGAERHRVALPKRYRISDRDSMPWSRLGRIFLVIWTEPLGDATKYDRHLKRNVHVQFGQTIHYKIQRFVAIQGPSRVAIIKYLKAGSPVMYLCSNRHLRHLSAPSPRPLGALQALTTRIARQSTLKAGRGARLPSSLQRPYPIYPTLAPLETWLRWFGHRSRLQTEETSPPMQAQPIKKLTTYVTLKDSFHYICTRYQRANEPYTRRDHYRDHLRDFHEDIGCAKSENWRAAQTSWTERNINRKDWHYLRCCAKIHVSDVCWERERSSCRSFYEDDWISNFIEISYAAAGTTIAQANNAFQARPVDDGRRMHDGFFASFAAISASRESFYDQRLDKLGPAIRTHIQDLSSDSADPKSRPDEAIGQWSCPYCYKSISTSRSPTFNAENCSCVEVDSRNTAEHFSRPVTQEHPMHHFNTTQWSSERLQSYVSSSFWGPRAEREDQGVHLIKSHLPLEPETGLNESQHRRTASFPSTRSYPAQSFLGNLECYEKPSTQGPMFSTLWTDNHFQGLMTGVHPGQKVFSTIRRSIIVQFYGTVCSCLPEKPRISATDHGLTFSSQRAPQGVDARDKTQLTAKLIGEAQKIFKYSRINFRQLYDVEITVKIKDVAKLSSALGRLLRKYCDQTSFVQSEFDYGPFTTARTSKNAMLLLPDPIIHWTMSKRVSVQLLRNGASAQGDFDGMERNIQDQQSIIDSDKVKLMHGMFSDDNFDITFTLAEIDKFSMSELTTYYRTIPETSQRNVTVKEAIQRLKKLRRDLRRLVTKPRVQYNGFFANVSKHKHQLGSFLQKYLANLSLVENSHKLRMTLIRFEDIENHKNGSIGHDNFDVSNNWIFLPLPHFSTIALVSPSFGFVVISSNKSFLGFLSLARIAGFSRVPYPCALRLTLCNSSVLILQFFWNFREGAEAFLRLEYLRWCGKTALITTVIRLEQVGSWA